MRVKMQRRYVHDSVTRGSKGVAVMESEKREISQEDREKWWQSVNLRDLRVGSMMLKEKKELSKADVPKSCFQLNDNCDLFEVYTPKVNANAQPGTQIKHGRSSHAVLERSSAKNDFCGD